MNLKEFFEAAQVSPIPDFFEHIQIVDPDTQKPLVPRPHQASGLSLTFTNARTGIWDEQGTGKSIIAQAMLIWHAAMGNKCVGIMPPILIGQFRRNLLRTFPGIDGWMKIAVYDGTPKERNKQHEQWAESRYPDLVIMTYEMFIKEWSLFSDYVVAMADECRLLSSGETKFYHALEAFMKTEEKAALVMNGTPANTDLRQLYGYIKFLTPDAYKSKMDFELQHVIYRLNKVEVKAKNGQTKVIDTLEVEGFRNLDRLRHNLYRHARRVEKSEVLSLKDKHVNLFHMALSKTHLAAYKQFVTEKMLVFPDNSIIDGSNASAMRVLAMQAINDPSVLGLTEESLTIAAVNELISQVDMEATKVVIAAHHHKTVELFRDKFAKWSPAVIYGKTPGKNESEKNRFLSDPKCRLLIVNYLSGGVGLNLQSVSHTGIAVEPTGSPGAFDQWGDRMHRSGQTHPVNIYILMPARTVFKKLVDTMLRRQAENNSVVSKASLLSELLGD